MKELKEMIIKANEQLKRIRDYVTEHDAAFADMNLKLHNAIYYQCTDMEKDFPLCFADNEKRYEDSYFYQFCEATYDQFTDWCAEEGIDFNKMCHHIGRTSSFYLYDKEIVQRERWNVRCDWTMYNCFNELGYTNYYQMVEFTKEGNIDEEETLKFDEDYWTESEWIDEIKPAIRYIIEEMYDDFVKEVADIIKVYEYIKDTKDNQVEYFKEWLQFYEDELAEEKRKADEEGEKRLNIIAKMPEKVHNIMKRSALDSEDLEVVLGCMV